MQYVYLEYLLPQIHDCCTLPGRKQDKPECVHLRHTLPTESYIVKVRDGQQFLLATVFDRNSVWFQQFLLPWLPAAFFASFLFSHQLLPSLLQIFLTMYTPTRISLTMSTPARSSLIMYTPARSRTLLHLKHIKLLLMAQILVWKKGVQSVHSFSVSGNSKLKLHSKCQKKGLESDL